MLSSIRPILSLLLGLLFMVMGHGLQMVLIPLRAEGELWSTFQIGWLGSVYYLGFVAGCLGVPHLIRHSGHIRAFMAIAAIISATMMATPLWVSFVPWLLLRIVFGFCIAGLYMIIESWLNDRATNSNRGFLMSAYIMVNYAALAIGQFTTTLYSPLEFSLFAICAISLALGAVPLALTHQAQPAPVAAVRFRPLELYRSSPVGLVGAGFSGLANGAFWSLGAVAAVGTGMSASQAAIFMGLTTAAGAVAQWPVGRFSDGMDRRIVLVALLTGGAVFGLLLAFLPVPKEGWFILCLFFGFSIAPTYSVSAAHAYDHAKPGTMVETVAGLFMASAIGSIVGPLIAASIMGHLGPAKLFLYTAVVNGLLAIYVVTRIRSRSAPAKDEKTDFDLAATAPVGGVVVKEAEGEVLEEAAAAGAAETPVADMEAAGDALPDEAPGTPSDAVDPSAPPDGRPV